MNYPDTVQFLYALGNEVKTAKLGLDRVEALAGTLGAPQRGRRFVHVAGTNGKGSVCAMIEAGLRAAGLRTGLFTSPHLLEPVERIRINSVPVEPERFAAAFARVHETAEQMLDVGQLDLHPTYFETVVAMALLTFQEAEVDVAVLETGLGGRLDATNIVLPEVAVVTPVDYDHEALLGKSIEAIALEKAGILKLGVPAVFARQRPEAAAVLERRAGELGVPIVHTADFAVRELEMHPGGSRFLATGPGTLRIDCPLAGEHQVGRLGEVDRGGVVLDDAVDEQGVGGPDVLGAANGGAVGRRRGGRCDPAEGCPDHGEGRQQVPRPAKGAEEAPEPGDVIDVEVVRPGGLGVYAHERGLR